MRKQLIFIIIFISLAFCQQINQTQNAHLYGGSKYFINENSGSEIKFHAITCGQNIVGSASSASYNMDFGIWAFYLKEPDPPTVDASDGDPKIDGIAIIYNMDPLSPPAYLAEPIPNNIDSYDLGGYPTSSSVSENVIALTKSQENNTSTSLVNIDQHPMIPGAAYDWDQDVRPGIMYSFGVTAFNTFGLSPEGTDIGFTLPNGRVEGSVNVPGSLPGTTGNAVQDVEIIIQRADGQTIGHSLQLDGGDYLYAENIYDELLEDTLQTSDMSIEFWFKNPESTSREYIVDMDEMLSIYQENSSITTRIGNDEITTQNPDLSAYSTSWHHIAITKGNRGACLREDEDFTDCGVLDGTTICEGDANWDISLGNGQWDGGEDYIDVNQNSFYDAAGVVDGIVVSDNCNSNYSIEIDGTLIEEEFTWNSTYYASGIRLYLNGVLDVSTASSNATIMASNIFNIGRSKDGTNFYSGSIDDLYTLLL